jgi:hypothetical protein
MGGGAFILLKSQRAGPESAKQVEIRLANLLKILSIAVTGPKRLARTGDDMRRLYREISSGYG